MRKDLDRGSRGTYRFLEVCDEVIPVLILLQASEGHLGTRDVLEKSVELSDGRDSEVKPLTFLGFSRYSKRVCSSQVTPLLTLAAV